MMRSDPAVVGAPQPWPPPPPPPSPPPLPSSSSVIVNATDEKGFLNCTPGICTSDCPQSCGFYILSPPPPFDTGDDDSSGRISPLMAALIAVLAAAFLLLFYYTVVSRFCRRQRHRRRNLRAQILHESDDHPEIRLDPMVQDPTRPNGLDEAFIRQITVFKYRRADGLIDGTDCAVCLSEFKEEENLRLMPNCEHAFHIPCIDTWLKTHSSCPLCRATMNPIPPRPTPTPSPNPNPNPNPSANGTTASVAEMRVQSGNDIVLLVREVVGSGDEEVVVCHETEDDGCGDSEERESEEEVRKGENNQR